MHKTKEVEFEIKQGGGFSTLLKGILIGGLIGAGYALISTPRSGEETRQMLREKSTELKQVALEKADETRAKAEELTHAGRERLNEVKVRGQSVIHDGKNRVESIVEGVKEGVQTYTESNQTGLMDEPAHTQSLAAASESDIQPVDEAPHPINWAD